MAAPIAIDLKIIAQSISYICDSSKSIWKYIRRKSTIYIKVTAINKQYNSISILRLIAIAFFCCFSYYYIQGEVVFLLLPFAYL
jgi:hypothetical protein